MEICMMCGKEFDSRMEPDHEEECTEGFTTKTRIRIKPIPQLEEILKGVIDEK